MVENNIYIYCCVCRCACICMLSHVQLFETPWIVAHRAPLSMEFSRQEYWSGLPFPSPGDLPDPEAEPAFLVFPALAGRFFTIALPGKPVYVCMCVCMYVCVYIYIYINKTESLCCTVETNTTL